MVPLGFVFLTAAVLLCSIVACLFGLISGGALALAWVLAFAGLLGLLLVLDGHGGLRRTGAGLLAAVALGLALMVGIAPAHAEALTAIAAPPGDTGFWGSLNGWIATALGSIATGAITMACTALRTRAKINIRTDQEQRVIELMKTGAFQGAHELEIAIDGHFTPAQRQKLIERMVGWAESRGVAELKKLGLPGFVVTGMARKALGQLQGLGVVGADFDPIDAAVTGQLHFTGNPGETPALDRAAGGTGGN